MSEPNSYDTLGLDESSSFDEIQAARTRLLAKCGGDRKQMDTIEAAYDAILMERLRLRQEGKIKVPDRIRFAEEPTEEPAAKPPTFSPERWAWADRWLDTPAPTEVLRGALIYGGLAVGGALFAPSLALAVGVGCTLYFLNRKEYRFWRALLITFVGLVLGMAIGILVGQALASQGLALGTNSDALAQGVATAITLFVFWLVSSFLH